LLALNTLPNTNIWLVWGNKSVLLICKES
jgi:hypothetical protein